MCMAKVGVSFVALSSCSPYLERIFQKNTGFWETQNYCKESAMSRLVEGGVQVHSS